VKENSRTEQRLRLKPAQRARLLKLAGDRNASRKDREWARKQLSEMTETKPLKESKLAGPKATLSDGRKKRLWTDLDAWLAAQPVRRDLNLAAMIAEERDATTKRTL
jgi:hypothetical protein